MARRIGSLRDTSFVGQDPKRRGQLEDQLFADFKPKDVLEEIWLSDIATLTASIEYFRKMEVCLNLQILEQNNITELLEFEKYMNEENGEKSDHIYLDSKSFEIAMGSLTATDLKNVNTMIDLINNLRRERDRIFHNFDRKRRPTLIQAVKVSEMKQNSKIRGDLAD